ncbi:hypothetical protein BKA62DRAFT_681699 [Auriculariales sp. MPI-PUGE-AT-0066]|nr:hypothetical protein BKA62DRAFT_681699 [Auriculariales sp. MPI-PUGE-AT-0066]
MSTSDSSPTTSAIPTATESPTGHSPGLAPAIEFIIGLLIVFAASILNAAGLTATKYDHTRNASIPKSARRHDWLRPLWLLGMVLYILSQLIGSTLALEYMRAEYVAPLGSSSLVFNFLFAYLTLGTQITRNDILGTCVVVVGVVGIVLFGGWNSGLASDMNLSRLISLWSRLGWLLYFIFYTFGMVGLYLTGSQLDAILAARADLDAVPFAAEVSRNTRAATTWWQRVKALFTRWGAFLEHWTAAQTDRQLAWTLGIVWSLCGGGLAGECLVFAKAAVKLVSGKLSHENGGNQFAHPAPIFTFIFLGCTAVAQIVALNRGLRAYDSTLVVPTFYGVYTAAGFVNSLIFNNEVDAYKGWVLALIFLSILVLIAGVVLLTHEKPDPSAAAGQAMKLNKLSRDSDASETERNSKEGRRLTEAEMEQGEGAQKAAWQLGADSDDEEDSALKPSGSATRPDAAPRTPRTAGQQSDGPQKDERTGLINDDEDEDDDDHSQSHSHPPAAKLKTLPSVDDEEFGDWEDGKVSPPESLTVTGRTVAGR